MPIDKKVFIKDYVQEAGEYLDALFDLTIKVSKDSRNSENVAEILRVLHSFKGSSRILGFNQIEKIVHSLENVFKSIQNNQTEIPSKINQLLINSISVLKEAVDSIKKTGLESIKSFNLIEKNIEFAANGEDFSVDFVSENEKNAEFDAVERLADEVSTDDDNYDNQIIKISVSQINSILQFFDKMIMSQIKMKKLISDYNNWELKETMEILENQTFGIQGQIISLRMLPLDMILQPIKQSVVTEAVNLSKNVEFDIPHSEITIDKAILENLPKILIHLVRNSLDHGIESPEERKAAGKNEKGLVSIKVYQQSNRIIVTVTDDGRGIDFETIRDKAERLFPDRIKEISQFGEDSLLQFIFMSGFSTRDSVSELSGRGVGLDVVRTEIDKLKGKISVKSQKGKGTTFELSLPLSLATQDGLFIQEGNNKYLVLSHYIREIVTVKKSAFIQMRHGLVLTLHDELIPVYNFESITGNASGREKTVQDNTPVIVIEYLNRKIAINADSILHYNTVVIKPLPPIMKKFEGLQGIIFDENYSIIPVLNIPYCMNRFKSVTAFEERSLAVQKKRKIYSILIADDSHSTRHIEKIILEAEGYNVSAACDGIEALELLKHRHFDLVISDVRMPRMDGFVLLHNMRHSEELKNIPVIFVTSIYESDTKQKIEQLGAQGYIVKSDFERENLVGKVKELLGDE